MIVPDLEPELGNVLWYRFRSWIESSYRDVKSDGWQWHKTRLREPARAERIWLAMAVATLWTVTMVSEQPEESSSRLDDMAIFPQQEPQKSELKKTIRNISVFLQGLINIIADLLCGKGISLNSLCPQSEMAVNTS